MRNYKIHYKAQTLAQLSFFEPTKAETIINGFKITNWDFSIQEGPFGNAWMITKDIQASSAIEALNLFRKAFYPIAEKIGFVSQCYFEFGDQSFIIEQLDNNPDRVFLLRMVTPREPVGLHFGSEELENYRILERNLKDNLCFMYLQACNNTIGYYPKLSLLLSALEALAGKVAKKNETSGKEYTTYNKDTMIEILGGSYFNEVFGEDGVRHKMHHGDFTDKIVSQNHVSIISSKIISYLNSTYGTKLNTDIVAPQRNFYGNFKYHQLFIKPKSITTPIDLTKIPENIHETLKLPDSEFIYVHGIDINTY